MRGLCCVRCDHDRCAASVLILFEQFSLIRYNFGARLQAVE